MTQLDISRILVTNNKRIKVEKNDVAIYTTDIPKASEILAEKYAALQQQLEQSAKIAEKWSNKYADMKQHADKLAEAFKNLLNKYHSSTVTYSDYVQADKDLTDYETFKSKK